MNPARMGHRHAIGFTRREVMQVGYSGLLGMGLTSLLAGRARADGAAAVPGRRGKGKSVILIFLTGAPSHVDTFDMKPEAPDKVRGDFKPIDTRVPGYQVCEHLPGLAGNRPTNPRRLSGTEPAPAPDSAA